MSDELQNNRSEALNQLIKDLGIDTLSEDKQNELIIKMTEVLLKRIFLETMEKLGDEGREAYEKLTEGENTDPAQVEAFFKERIEGYDKMIENVILEFKEEMMNANTN